MAHDFDNKQMADHCEPTVPCPPPSTDEMCEGRLEGHITGKVYMENCCCKLYSRTFIVNIGPQSEANLIVYLQNTVNAYENAGYVILAHSLVDAGAGWILGLSVGWQA